MKDLLVIGGGINGAGIARDAAGRGLSVVLCEQGDLAGGTSSASTKLIHGGLRYLEHMRFRLVREALVEREVLLRAAPHIIWPMRFVLPHHKGLRPAWMLRLGLWLYDHLGGRKRLAGTTRANLRAGAHADVLQDRLAAGFEYSDCWVDDARLVVLNALDAHERGAEILVRTKFISAHRNDGHWQALLERDDRTRMPVEARAIVNAAGPWAGTVAQATVPGAELAALRLVKGSHIVVRRLYQGDHAYIFQNPDNRVVFAIPYDGDYTLIGTTDVPYEADPGAVRISAQEIDYLCAAVSGYFVRPVAADDVIWSYSGVRPLYDDRSGDASTATRDYVLGLDAGPDAAPLLSVFGGKITTYRKLAEQALAKLAPYLEFASRAWTESAALPGGDMPDADFAAFEASVGERYSWLTTALRHRLSRAYGTRIDRVVASASSLGDLGSDFGAGLHEAEVRYLIDQEWARTADDILWRRSKLGLHMSAEQRAALASWIADQEASAPK